MSRFPIAAAVAALMLSTAAYADGTLKAQYLFQNTLASSVGGAPALTLVDPTGTSGFITDIVRGNSRTLLHIDGTATPAQQGGLTFQSNGLLTGNSYSMALTLEFIDKENAWRRISDTLDRTNDAGFYVDPSNHLDIYPVSGSNVTVDSGTYRNIILTVAADGTVSGYADGQNSFSTNTNVMNIGMSGIISLFLDNTQGGGQGEWSAANIASAAFYDGVLSAQQIATINGDPFTPPTVPGAVPEPASWATMIAGFGLVGAAARRRPGIGVARIA